MYIRLKDFINETFIYKPVKIDTLSELLNKYHETGDLRSIKTNFTLDDKVKWYFNGLLKIIKEVRLNNIDSYDYKNPQNLGIKENGNLAFFDMGFGNGFTHCDIDVEKLLLDDNGNMQLVLKKLFDIKQIRKLGGGLCGNAFYIGDNRVMKITTDNSEVMNAKKLLGKKNKYLCDIYDIKRFKNKDGKDYYVIIMEYLRTPKMIISLDKKLNQIIEDKRNNHLDVSVLNEINNVLIRNFMLELFNIGNGAWDKYRKEIIEYENKHDIDFNQVSDIVEWIKGSKTNKNYNEDVVPSYILRYLKKLIKKSTI